MSNDGLLSNSGVFLEIAEDALSKALDFELANRTLKDNGDGYIIRFDPDRNSFKQSLIAIAFACAYFEAVIYIKLLRNFGLEEATKIDRKEYEKRLSHLGVNDENMLKDAERLRTVRKDFMHEKAVENTKPEAVYYAQIEAKFAVEYVQKVGIFI